MDFSEYQVVARSTAKYPNAGSNVYYPVLGLTGETGEVLEKVAEIYRSSDGVTPDALRLLSKEFGDVLWYSSAVSSEINLPLATLTGAEDIAAFQRLHSSAEGMEDAFLAALDVGSAAGGVAEVVKKIMRDNGGVLDDGAKDRVSAALLLVLTRLARLASLVNVDLAEAAHLNAEKLADRARRNVISGSGDER